MVGIEETAEVLYQPSGDYVRSEHQVEARIIWGPVQPDSQHKVSVPGELTSLIREGFPVGAVSRLVQYLDVPQSTGLSLLQLKPATYSRRKEKGKLDAFESDRVYRYAKLAQLATAMFHGDEEEAKTWLKTPLSVFSDETPLERAQTEFGANQVEQLIGRIRHGIPT